MEPKKRRIQELDSLRGLAALAVVLFHYTTRYNQKFGHADSLIFELPYGYYGVHLFFIISGFVITLSTEKVKKPLDFIFLRASRLYPTYWFCILLTFSVLYFTAIPEEVNFLQVIGNFTMIQTLLGVPNVDNVYGSLFIELMFYGFIFCIIIFDKKRRIKYTGGALVLVNAILLAVDFPHQTKVYAVLMSVHFYLFQAGIIFYDIFKSKKIQTFDLICLLVCMITPLLLGEMITFGLVLFFFSIFMAFVYEKAAILISKPLLFLGAISYSLYLTHQNLGYNLIYILEESGVNSNIAIFISIGCAIFLAYLIYRFIEKPSLNYLRKRYKRFRLKNPVN